jgi:Mor family transcriptional regulator
MADKRHELLSDIADHAAHVMREHGVPADVAEQAGAAVADHLCDAWAGSTVCFPKDYRFKITQRDLKILAEFNGRNHHELAKRWGLTENAIYKLLKRIQERKFDRDQGKLDL